MRPKPSSAANGRLSQGPSTQAGKDRSRFNAIKHGLSARRLLLIKGESPEELEYVDASFKHTFKPDSTSERFVVDQMVAGKWRLFRAQAMETALMQEAVEQTPQEGDPADALLKVLEDKRFSRLARYQNMLENSFSRSLRNLILIKKNFPSDVISEQVFEEILAEQLASKQAGAEQVATAPPQPEVPKPAQEAPVPKSPEPAPRKLTFTAAAIPNAPANPHPDPGRMTGKAAA